jgi:hypothetical protein
MYVLSLPTINNPEPDNQHWGKLNNTTDLSWEKQDRVPIPDSEG